MFRKLLIAAVPVLGLSLPLVGATSAEAHEHYHAYRHGYHAPVRFFPAPRYCAHVYYRVNCNLPWVCAGEFATPYAAQCAAGGYQASGYEVRIGG